MSADRFVLASGPDETPLIVEHEDNLHEIRLYNTEGKMIFTLTYEDLERILRHALARGIDATSSIHKLLDELRHLPPVRSGYGQKTYYVEPAVKEFVPPQ